MKRLTLFLLSLTFASQGWGQVQMDRIAPKAVNNVWQVSQLPGATADAKVSYCLTNYVASGGVCDARGFGATTQSWAATVTVNGGQTVLFDPSTKFQATMSALNIFTFEPNAIIRGFTFDCTNQPSYSGIVLQNDTSAFYTNGQNTEISNILVNASCKNVTGIIPLKLNSTSGSAGVAFLNIHDWMVYSNGDGALLTSSGTGFVNDIHFVNMHWSNSAHGLHFNDGGGALLGNTCFPCTYEKDSIGTNGVLMDGSGGSVNGNVWIGSIFDTTVPISITDTAAAKNAFIGRFDGTYADNTNNSNNFWSLAPSSIPYIFSVRGLQSKVLGSGGTSDAVDIFDTTPSASNPHKYLRIANGVLQILNSLFTNDVVDISDTGLVTAKGGLNVGGGVNLSLIQTYNTASITPTAVTAATCSDQTFTVTGLVISDRITQIVPPGALGNVSLNAYPSASNTVLFHFCNPTAGSVTPPAGVYSLTAFH